MDPLPVELWRQVVQDLDTWGLLAVSTTSRALSVIAQDVLYDKVHITSTPRDHEDALAAAPRSRAAQFARSLAARPALAPRVRALTLCAGRRAPLDTAPPRSNPVFPQLTALAQLQRLTLRGYHVDAACCAAFAALPNLTALTLAGCTLDGDAALAGADAPRRALFTLSITSPLSAPEEAWATFARPGLRALALGDFGRSHFAPTRGVELLADVARRDAHTALTALDWNHAHVPAALIALLNGAPALQRLAFRHADALCLSEHVTALARGALPRLAYFQGPADYARTFVAGRPVRTAVLILEPSTPLDALAALQSASAPVEELELRQCAEFVVRGVAPALPYAPPTLRRLATGVAVRKEDLAPWLRAVARMPGLRVLEFGGCLDALRADVVAALGGASPALQEVVFGGDEPWLRRNGGAWERCFRFRSRAN